jgi:hypothetical protein
MKEMTMRDDQRPILVQRWVVVTDEQGRQHVEARWTVESRIGHTPVPHAA